MHTEVFKADGASSEQLTLKWLREGKGSLYYYCNFSVNLFQNKSQNANINNKKAHTNVSGLSRPNSSSVKLLNRKVSHYPHLLLLAFLIIYLIFIALPN